MVTCTGVDGWGIDPATQKHITQRTIRGEDFVMRKTASGYKLAVFLRHELDCSNVKVKGVTQ